MNWIFFLVKWRKKEDGLHKAFAGFSLWSRESISQIYRPPVNQCLRSTWESVVWVVWAGVNWEICCCFFRHSLPISLRIRTFVIRPSVSTEGSHIPDSQLWVFPRGKIARCQCQHNLPSRNEATLLTYEVLRSALLTVKRFVP